MVATQTEQPIQIENKNNAAGTLWEQWMEAAPIIQSILSLIGSGIEFLIGGHFIVAIGHRVIKTAGRVAETALLLATLWVTAVNVAPGLVNKVGRGNVDSLNDLSMMAFSLLPEIIVFSAIIVTYQHWTRFFSDRRRLNPAWIWACLYSVPTLSFIIMTVITISSFAAEQGAGTTHATGVALVIRCLSGWFYGLIELIFASIGKGYRQTYTIRQVEDQMAALVATTRATLEQQVATVLTDAQRGANDQVASIQGYLSTSVAKIQESTHRQVATLLASINEERDARVASMETAIRQQVARSGTDQQGISTDQFEMLVQLINRQAATIQQLSSSLAEVRKETKTVVTEIREIRSFTQEAPAAIGAPPAIRALPTMSTTIIEQDSTEKPGPRVLRFLQECQGRGYKPTLAEIQEVCQVAKKTATTYRKSFYGEGESSQTDEEE